MSDERKGTARAAEAADALMHGEPPKGGRAPRGGSSRQRTERDRTEAPEVERKETSLSIEQRLHVVEEELKAAARVRQALTERVERLTTQLDTVAQHAMKEFHADPQPHAEELRVLRAQVDDLTVQVSEARQQRGWRFGVSFDLLTLM